MKRLLIVSLALLPLAGCNFWSTTTPPVEEEQTSSRPETKNVIYRGRLEVLGTSIYMEGTHRLVLEDGRFVLLEGDGLVLNEYLGKEVEVFGTTRATVEGGAIIMRVERVANFVESSEAVSSDTSSSAVSSVVSSETVSSTAPIVSSKAAVSRAPVRSSAASIAVPPPPPVSSAAATVSSASSTTSDPLAARTAMMAKANMAASNWTQQYCSTHISFCIPVHKNWYYVSFGATSSSLWHVELSAEEIETLGDGPLTIVLLTGAASVPDGQVTIDGEIAVGVRTWTNGRHFEIRAPKALEQAVRYITQELKAAPSAAQ